MSKELIERLRFDASVRVNSTAMTAADNLVKAADALEIAIAGMNAYSDELGRCRNAAGFGSTDDPMAQEGFDAFGDPLCVAAFVESQFTRIVAERDTLAAELKALREQEPVAWYCDRGDWGREYNGLPEMSDGDIGAPLYARPAPADPVNARLLDTLKKCRDQFQRYVEHHLDKGDYDKAAANESFAWLAGAAISKAEKQPAEAGG